MVKILYNEKDSYLNYFECDIEIKSLKINGFIAKYVDVKDNILIPVNNVEIIVEPTKGIKGISETKDEEPRIIKGLKYKLTIKRI